MPRRSIELTDTEQAFREAQRAFWARRTPHNRGALFSAADALVEEAREQAVQRAREAYHATVRDFEDEHKGKLAAVA